MKKSPVVKSDDKDINAIIKSLERDELMLSDGFGYYTGEEYDKTMRKVAEHILKALSKKEP